MQLPNELDREEIINLMQYLNACAQDKSPVNTTANQKFSFRDHCQLAYMIWQRVGKNEIELHRSWCAMLQSNPSVNDVMALVAFHVYSLTI